MLTAACLAGAMASAVAAPACKAERAEKLVPKDPALCARLEAVVWDPSAKRLGEYEKALNQYFGHYCHRDTASGWRRDKRMRATGPFVATTQGPRWKGVYRGTHNSVVIWYSPKMADWLVANRSPAGQISADAKPIPDGAIMVKEMFPEPASGCRDVDPLKLFPEGGAAVMVRDNDASHDGWFWGWYGFGKDSGWRPDYPPAPTNPLANMGFGQYCMNCHASAQNNLTFASPRNMQGEPGEPIAYFSQHEPLKANAKRATHHEKTAKPPDRIRRIDQPRAKPDDAVVAALSAYVNGQPTPSTVSRMPSQTYDDRHVGAGGPDASDTFLTSSQCIGCHDAGGTGMQFDMTKPNPHGEGLVNESPYATWRTSPMGLAGRDPIFFAQMASETETFHPDAKGLVQDTCLGCHGVQGQRQFHIDDHAKTGECRNFTRADIAAMPQSPVASHAGMAKYGALARDGISCTACHRSALATSEQEKLASEPQNACVRQRQQILNPDNEGFAKTFTGSYFVGDPDRVTGPYPEPKTAPMRNAIGNVPEHDEAISNSVVCGSCHTIHLPVLQEGKTLTHAYEQTTYPEWAFSDFRTGVTPDGDLPFGAGSKAQSCQDCHMPGMGEAERIASIQEKTGFPQSDFSLGSDAVDLEERENPASHTLVGLNVFLVKMAQQFPEVFGLRTEDPMLGSRGVDPLVTTERKMLEQARKHTASVSVEGVERGSDALRARVKVVNKVGHKFPSGVGFRRAFLEVRVLDAEGTTLWVSGGTDRTGALVDENGEPLTGEYWWQKDCSARIAPLQRRHQPHFQTIHRQDQAQIYQELVSTPPEGANASMCGSESEPLGHLTTSFLSLCSTVKDNRLLPSGYLSLEKRKKIAAALGAGEDLARESGSTVAGTDPDYTEGGTDTLTYAVALSDLPDGAKPARVEARLYYQATPPFYLQDRMCTSKSADTARLGFLASRLDLDNTRAESWKLLIAEASRSLAR